MLSLSKHPVLLQRVLVGATAFVIPLGTHLVLRDAAVPYLRISITLFDVLALITVTLYPNALKDLFTQRTRVIASIALFELIVAMSLIWSSDRFATLSGLLHIILFVQWMAIVFFERHAALVGFIGGAVVQASLGLTQFFLQRASRLPFLGSAGHDPFVLGTSVVGTTDGRWLRPYGTLPHPNVLGGFLAIALVLTLVALLRDDLTKRWRLAALASLPVLAMGLIATYSRAAWLAFGVAVVLIGVAAIRAKNRPALLGLGVACTAGAIMAVLTWSLLTTRVTGAGRLEELSSSGRQRLEQNALVLVREHPFRGVGYHAMTSILMKRDPTIPSYELQPVHNGFLLTFVETGFFGIFSLVIILSALMALKPRSLTRGALIACLVVPVLFDHWLFSLEVGVALWWTTLGYCLSEVEGVRYKKGPPPSETAEVMGGGAS